MRSVPVAGRSEDSRSFACRIVRVKSGLAAEGAAVAVPARAPLASVVEASVRTTALRRNVRKDMSLRGLMGGGAAARCHSGDDSPAGISQLGVSSIGHLP